MAAPDEDRIELLTRQLERERRARRSAEDIGEAATAELWHTVQRLEAAETDLREDAEHLRYRQRLSRDMRQRKDPHAVMDLVVRSLGPRLDVSRCLVYFTDRTETAPSPVQWTVPGIDRVPTDMQTPPTMSALASEFAARHESLIITDIETDARIDPASAADVVRRYGCRAFASVPLKSVDRMLGWLVLQSREAREWRPQDRALLDGVAADLSSALLQVVAHQAQEETVRTLREVSRAKSDFVATVSHELRTPLASISGYLEMCLDEEFGPLNPNQTHAMTVALRNCGRLQELVDNLLDLSRAEEPPEEVSTDVEVDLASVVEDAHRSLSPAMDARRITFELETDGAPATLVGHPAQLHSVALNLLSNAVKFSHDGGHVRASICRHGTHLTLTVRDTGHGIERADLAHVFRRFFRTSTASERAIPGSGLGLSVVKQIVEEHGGTVSVDSSPGEGATFVVAFPRRS